MGGHVTED